MKTTPVHQYLASTPGNKQDTAQEVPKTRAHVGYIYAYGELGKVSHLSMTKTTHRPKKLFYEFPMVRDDPVRRIRMDARLRLVIRVTGGYSLIVRTVLGMDILERYSKRGDRREMDEGLARRCPEMISPLE